MEGILITQNQEYLRQRLWMKFLRNIDGVKKRKKPNQFCSFFIILIFIRVFPKHFLRFSSNPSKWVVSPCSCRQGMHAAALPPDGEADMEWCHVRGCVLAVAGGN